MEFLSRSWKVMEFDVGKYVCSGAAYCSGLSEIYLENTLNYGKI